MAKKKGKGVCFVIAPIGEPDTPIRKRSDQIFRHVISPPVKELGYDPVRADQIPKPGLITDQVIQYILDAPLVIADLTGPNANVFYELAIRHYIGKPVVQIIEKGEPLPFDVKGMRTIFVDHTDLDSAEETKQEISRQIKALEADPTEMKTPIPKTLEEPAAVGQQGLVIHSAEYGAGNTQEDVTQQVRELVSAGKLEMMANHSALGIADPVPHVKKYLKVVYSHAVHNQTVMKIEGEKLLLP